MKRITKGFRLLGPLLLIAASQGCIDQSGSPNAESLVGKWNLVSVQIESTQLRWNCEKESTWASIERIDTLRLDARFPEFKESEWLLDISADTIRGPVEVENRMDFDWAFSKPVFIEQNNLDGIFGYVISGDTIYLSNRWTDVHKNHRLFYAFDRREESIELFPGVLRDTLKVPSPKPDSYMDQCISPDSTETKARLISALLRRR